MWFRKSKSGVSKSKSSERKGLSFKRPLSLEHLEERRLLAVFSNATPIAIPGVGTGPAEAAPYPSNILVFGIVGNVTSATATIVDFSHEAPFDVNVLLVGPTGDNVDLMGDAGGGNPGIAAPGVTYTFADGFPQLSAAAPPSPDGIYAPSQF